MPNACRRMLESNQPSQVPSRRDGRVVEGARLESVYRGNSIQGSNPCLSASLKILCSRLYANCGGNPDPKTSQPHSPQAVARPSGTRSDIFGQRYVKNGASFNRILGPDHTPVA